MENLRWKPDNVLSYKTDSNLTTFELKDGTKLSQVFDELPSGIINKTETGIGATTLELQARRNSIIVEPIRVTASGKAYKRTEELKMQPESGFANPGAFYIGSETPLHPKKITLQNILNYHNTPGFKKFVVVADSLYKVIKAIGPAVYNEYFLMLDEADAFQMDSTYRNSMDKCMDIFKKFPDRNRALVTATMLEFSDPEISSLSRIETRYQNPTTHSINLIHTDNLEGSAVETLTNLISQHPNDKILIAYNSPNGCVNIAVELEKNNILKRGEQTILCSVNSKKKAGRFFAELDKDVLPTKVNFITSAYFSGFDLHEDFHIVSVSDGGSFVLALSEHKLKQIAGRCRHNLLSQTIIYTTNKNSENIYTKEQLIEAGKHEVQALQCLHFHYENSPVLKANISKLRNLLLGSTERAMRYVRVNAQNEPVISFLNIDAIFEAQRVRKEIYSDPSQLQKALLNQGHQVSFTTESSELEVADQDLWKTALNDEIDQIMREVRSLKHPSHVDELSFKHNWLPRQKQMLEIINNYRSYVEWDVLLQLVNKNAYGRDNRKLINLDLKLYLTTYDPAADYKKHLFQYFPIGTSYTISELQKQWTLFFRHWDSTITVSSIDKATKLTAVHFETQKIRVGNRTELLSDNPLNINVKRYRTDEQKSLKELIEMLF